MKTTRRRVVLAISAAAVAYLVATATLMLLPASPAIALLLGLVILGLQVGITAGWGVREGFPRKYVVVGGIAELLLGLVIFWQATIFHGRFAPPGEELLPMWALWGLVGPAIVGVAMIALAVIHPRKGKLSAARCNAT